MVDPTGGLNAWVKFCILRWMCVCVHALACVFIVSSSHCAYAICTFFYMYAAFDNALLVIDLQGYFGTFVPILQQQLTSVWVCFSKGSKIHG